jgi:chemotaxis protein MotB
MTAWDTQAKSPVIIRKVIRKHEGGHHGGAWKVAYADFVTAMMALFIVLWLLNSDESTKKAVAGYFRDPSGASSGTGSGAAGSGESLIIGEQEMHKLKERMEGILRQLPEFNKALSAQVQMTVTGEGLRVELLESENGVFFETGNATPTRSGTSLLSAMATELGKLPNKIAIEGHTDSRPFTGNAYGNWELSVDRANTARRLMQNAGLRPDQISQVRGFADQRLKAPATPTDPSNRRVSVVVGYTQSTEKPDATPPAEHHESAEGHHS